MTPDQSMSLAVRAAIAPSVLILKAFTDHSARQSLKPDGSVVTDIDVAAERRISDLLRQESGYPIMGEELGLDAGVNPVQRWLVDPIDGTKSFTRGIPTFGTIVALEEAATGRAIAGAIHLPFFGQTYSAGLGAGAWRNGDRLRIGRAPALRDAIVSAPDSYQFEIAGLEREYALLRSRCRHLRGYTDCWAHAMAAAGAIDIVFEPYMNPWDIRATEILIAEAGGACVTRPCARAGAIDAIFGAKELVAELVELLQFV